MQGRTVSFKNTLIIMTSNLGSAEIFSDVKQDQKDQKDQKDAAAAKEGSKAKKEEEGKGGAEGEEGATAPPAGGAATGAASRQALKDKVRCAVLPGLHRALCCAVLCCSLTYPHSFPTGTWRLRGSLLPATVPSPPPSPPPR